jgi:Flp pilus assembly protein TadD
MSSTNISHRARRRFAPQARLGLGLVLALAAGCAKKPPQPAPLILISIDTLRSDHLPAYGYRGVETPAIDALRRDAVLFERAFSAAPLTAPSHASILSGEPPTVHGLRDNVGYTYPAARAPHLPRLLKPLGYRSGAAISAFVLRREVGFASDFDVYDDKITTRAARGLSGIQRTGKDTLAAILPWLRANAKGASAASASTSGDAKGSAPVFLFFHIYEPHAPYTPPPELAARYPFLYDGEIAAADEVVGELIAELKALGIYDAAAIVLLSDHGEGLNEHGEDGHGVFLYRHDLQVPLIVKYPRAVHAGSTVNSVVPLADVHATLLEFAGAKLSPEDQARSLVRLSEKAGPDRPVYSETYTPRLHFGWSELQSLVSGSHHYIHGPDPELYDLANDPGELANRVSDDRRTYAALRDQLSGMITPLKPPADVDEATRKELAALGYIGSAAVSGDAVLPDPKKMIHTLNYLHDGLEQFAQKKPADAARSFRKAVDANPLMVDAWNYLGRSYQQLRQPGPALEAFKKAMQLSGGQPEAALAAATTLVELGRPDEARLVIEHQISLTPEDLRLRYLRVRILLGTGKVPEAEQAAAEALKLAPDAADANYQVGAVAMAQRRLDVAERSLRRALELDASHPATLSDLAVLLASTGRPREAVPLLERLVALHPQDPAARTNLERVRAAAQRAGP